MMDSGKQHLETLSEIRSLMERSSKFISLSGLSGVSAGVIALAGAALAFAYLDKIPFDGSTYRYIQNSVENGGKWGLEPLSFFALLAAGVMILAVGAGILFTTRKARADGQAIWNTLTKRLLTSLAIPLATGGIFCLILVANGDAHLVASSTLIFYGLALVNASKFTLRDIRYLGLSEIVLGLISMGYIGMSLECWAIGFGVLHIVYGAVMYYRYDR
ncbi:MAG: hypothetical protein AAFO94_10910 [Bacteroidota bacterium]